MFTVSKYSLHSLRAHSLDTRLLSGVKITDFSSIVEAITVLHRTYFIPHVIITSLQLDQHTGKTTIDSQTLTIVGSTARKGTVYLSN